MPSCSSPRTPPETPHCEPILEKGDKCEENIRNPFNDLKKLARNKATFDELVKAARNVKMPFELSDQPFEKDEKDDYSDIDFENWEVKYLEDEC